MQRDRIDTLLTEYRVNVARAEFLTIRVESLTALLSELRANAVYYATSTTPVYSSDPKGAGGVPVSKVERLAMMLAEGRLPGELGDVEKELREAREELSYRRKDIALVDAWLNALQGRERYVLSAHVIDGQVWREVSKGFNERFGETYSRNGLRGILTKAQNKIYSIAN